MKNNAENATTDSNEGEPVGSPSHLIFKAERPASQQRSADEFNLQDAGSYDSSMTNQLDMIIDKSSNPEDGRSDHEFLFKRFQDFPELLGYKNYRCYEVVTIFINSMVNLVFNLTNLTYVFKLMMAMFSMPLIVIKLLTFLLYAAVIFLVIEPEKLRWMTTITMTTFMTISK